MFNPVTSPMVTGDSGEIINRRASELYRRLVSSARLKSFLARLFGKNRHLMALSEAICGETIESSSYAGQHIVDMDKIRGSESRSEDFDADFRPVKEHNRDRWVSVARAFLRGQELPPVDLIQVGDSYYIRDGHHRVSVARSLGQRYIEADIILFTTRRPPL